MGAAVSGIEALTAGDNSVYGTGFPAETAEFGTEVLGEAVAEAADIVYIEEVLWTDIYRYTRASALRSIERSYPPDSEGLKPENALALFPRLPGRREVSPLVGPAVSFSSEFFQDISPGTSSEFTTDARGRILTETRLGEDGTILGTFTNVWTGEHLASVHWEAETETRRIEFEYNAQGDRVSERNYRNDILVRSVESSGTRDVEELYFRGRPVLRAVWENGRKISEEPLRSGRAGMGTGLSEQSAPTEQPEQSEQNEGEAQ
jgi:hypothetical protein